MKQQIKLTLIIYEHNYTYLNNNKQQWQLDTDYAKILD